MYCKINGANIVGISACVPKTVDEVAEFPLFDESAVKKFVGSTGIERRRKAGVEVCSSDLCFAAADRLLKDLGWKRESISVLIFVSQTADYPYLQHQPYCNIVWGYLQIVLPLILKMGVLAGYMVYKRQWH